jgi:hypothetical protein
MSEWLLLNNFSAMSWREQIMYRWYGVRFVLEQYNYICCIFIVLSHWITGVSVRGYICRFIRTYYLDSEPTSLCVYPLMLCAKRKNNKYQFVVSLWFDQTAGRAHHLIGLEAYTLTISQYQRCGVVLWFYFTRNRTPDLLNSRRAH